MHGSASTGHEPSDLFVLPVPFLEYPVGTRMTHSLWSLIRALAESFENFTNEVKDFFKTPHLSDMDFLDEPGLLSPGYIEDLLSTFREGLQTLLSIGTLASYSMAHQRVAGLKAVQARCAFVWDMFKDGVSSIPRHLRYSLDSLNAKIGAVAGVIHSAQAIGADSLILWKYNGGPEVDKILKEASRRSVDVCACR